MYLFFSVKGLLPFAFYFLAQSSAIFNDAAFHWFSIAPIKSILLWKIPYGFSTVYKYSIMDEEYKVPNGVSIGHVHLKVADLEKSLDFYCKLLGFELITTYGKEAAFISAGGYHHHIGLNTWFSRQGSAPAKNATGLFHAAIRYPNRRDLATIFKRLQDFNYPITGMADHGVSEAIYLNDPDQNGLELYWDRPMEHWPRKQDGSIDMYTAKLNISSLLNELKMD